MKTAVVTGASSGIGRACAQMLVEQGFKVYGISRDPKPFTDVENGLFVPISCDLTDRRGTAQVCKRVREETGNRLDLLLNSAGAGHFAPHEELSHDAIHEMVALDLEAPLLLANIFLRDIRAAKGFIINISSITAMHPSPRGCAYAASKAGLLHFSRSLFEETRKSGVKVVCIIPDITRTPFFDDLDFGPGDAPDTFIEPECIADAVRFALSQREGTVLTEMVVRPQRFGIAKKVLKQGRRRQ